MPPSRIDLAHQANFCLTDSYAVCPWLSITEPHSVHAGVLGQPDNRVVGRSSLRVLFVAAAFWLWLRLEEGESRRFLWSRARDGLIALSHLPGMLKDHASQPTQHTRSRAPTAPDGFLERRSEAAALVERGILAMRESSREVAYRLFVQASGLDPSCEKAWYWRAILSEPTEEKRECLEQILRVNPASTFAKSALTLLDQHEPQPIQREPEPDQPDELPPRISTPPRAATALPVESLPLGQPSVKPANITWQCVACRTVNIGLSRLCRACGRPSSRAEEELTCGGDELLVQGLSELKAGDEDLAHSYFAMACENSPNSELAWYWRAKTALTLDEVIACLERLLELDPGNIKVQADLSWAQQRRQPQQVRRAPPAEHPLADEFGTPEAAVHLRDVIAELRWWLLQVAGVCTFALGLALTLPYGLRLAEFGGGPELGVFAMLLPGLVLPELAVHLPYLSVLDLGDVLPLLLGLLLLHATFVVIGDGGHGGRLWTVLLAAAAGGLILLFGTNPPASWFAAVLAAVAVAATLTSEPRESKP